MDGDWVGGPCRCIETHVEGHGLMPLVVAPRSSLRPRLWASEGDDFPLDMQGIIGKLGN